MERTTIIHPHLVTYRDPIRMRAGEEVKVGHEDTDYPGWVWCTDGRGKSGWVPKSILEFSFDGTEARPFEDYDAMEMSVAVGDTVVVLEEESGWVRCENEDGEQGWVPKKCLHP